ncbi:MAG: prephenate dehydrogenase/arogenate dehydrogenase family protein, partial [Corynebacterium flavescens]|uniref:prephenate dehydrogenase/arogenate dehydrogenase family protein n=1 Tax=Corynebacterium flavescens TaxID=28028 RepID=UPI002648D719
MSPSDVQRPICIIGLGLIGGSVLRDLVARKHPVYGYNHSTSRTRIALKQGFDVTDNLPEVLARAEADGALIVIAVPMNAVGSILDAIAEHAPTCGITDVVSVKSAVREQVQQRNMNDRYVGGHPMAGTALSGWEHSQKGLFSGAAWAITYDYADECDARGERVPKFWEDLFADVVRMTQMVHAEAVPVRVANHDAAVARVSHLPNVL